MTSDSTSDILKKVLNHPSPSFEDLRAAIYFGASRVMQMMDLDMTLIELLEDVVRLGYRIVDLMLERDFNAALTAEYSIAQQPVYEMIYKTGKHDTWGWRRLLDNLKVDMDDMVESKRQDFDALMVLIDARRFCKRLPRYYSDYIKDQLSQRSLYTFDWKLGDNPPIEAKLHKTLVQCYGLQLLKYSPSKSYTKKDVDAMLHEMLNTTDLEHHRLFAEIIVGFNGMMTDRNWLESYINYLNTLRRNLTKDTDILLFEGILIKAKVKYDDIRLTDDELKKYWDIMEEELSLHPVDMHLFCETHNLPFRRFKEYAKLKMEEFNRKLETSSEIIFEDKQNPKLNDSELPETREELEKMLKAMMKEAKEATSMTSEQYAAKKEWELTTKEQPREYASGLDLPPMLESLKRIRKAFNHLSETGHATFHKVIKAAADRQFFGTNDPIIVDWLRTEKMHTKDFPVKKTSGSMPFRLSNEELRCDTDRTFYSCFNHILHSTRYADKAQAFLKEVESKLRMLRPSADFKMADLDRMPWDAAHVFHVVMSNDLSLWEDELVSDDILTEEEIAAYIRAVREMNTSYWRHGDYRLKDNLKDCNRRIASIRDNVMSSHRALKKAGLIDLAEVADSFRSTIDQLLASV